MSGIISEYALEDGLFIRKDRQDTDEITRINDIERNSGENDQRGKDSRKVASIPLVVVEALKKRPVSEGGPIDINLLGLDPDHTVRFLRWLDDPDNRKFRTSEARLGNGAKYLQ